LLDGHFEHPGCTSISSQPSMPIMTPGVKTSFSQPVRRLYTVA
jgi:hypothetical protein